MVDAFSLKPQRDSRKNALAVAHAKGKLEKRLYFSPALCEIKQPHPKQSLFYIIL
jgi:hypothetical protein